MSPEQLSKELRTGTDEHLTRRRSVAALSLTAIGALGVVSLYQLGVLKHVPEPPLPRLDADAVDASAEAYRFLSMPDGVLGIGSYAVTLGLVAMGGKDRHRDHPWLPLALAGKAAVDALQAGRLTWTQWSRHRAFCSWCLTAAVATWVTLPLTLPEARAAWRRLR
jgi:uncharacterized membrane protein